MLPKVFNSKINTRKLSVVKVYYTKDIGIKLYPYIVTSCENVLNEAVVVSPMHGRSIIVNYDRKKKKYIIIKGCGLTYFPFGFVSTEEYEDFSWGFLRNKDAIRDYNCGNYISKLGVLTNGMEAVFSIEKQVLKSLDRKIEIEPTLLQYNVICPYRISDIPYLSKDVVMSFVNEWGNYFHLKYKEIHCNAAEVLIKNIRIMHDNNILHNSIHYHNYTLSLELLDFELSRTPLTPYENEHDEHLYKILQKREIIQSLEIVNQLAFHFKENLNYHTLRKIMINQGFEKYL